MSAVTLRIERLLARYHDVTPAERARFDGALAEVAGSALERAVAPTGFGDDAWAVCIAELQVRVEVGDTGTAACAAHWAEAILDALRDAADRPDDGIVVYRSKVDAIVDLVRGVAARDDRRAWAWRQVGLVTTHTGPGSVRRALLDEPRLAPVVLGAVGPEVVGAALTPADLAEVAARFAVLAGANAAVGVVADAGAGADPDVAEARGADAETLAVLVATTIPGPVWGWARLQPARVAVDLAVLATAIVAPLRIRDAGFVASVGRMAAGASGVGAGTGHDPLAPEMAADGEQEVPSRRPFGDGEGAPTRPEDEAAEPAGAAPHGAPEPEVVPTQWGGVWFLVRALTELDIVDALVSRGDVDAALVVTRIVEDVTGVPAEDPAVGWLAGTTDGEAPGADDDELVSDGVAAIRSWLDDRTRNRLVDDVRDRLWHRKALLHRDAAEIVIEFSLDDVDTGVRAAGLDLDPGWVWWLGAFVRFRYV